MKMLFWVFITVLVFSSIGLLRYQHKLIFFPEVLPPNYDFHFEQQFTELNYRTHDGGSINALHVRSQNSKGTVFYNHGNAGSLKKWGLIAEDFIKHDYDLFIYDYRGFGKSEGNISEENLYRDAVMLYEAIAYSVGEENIVLYGRSIGTGIATKLARDYNPKCLILESPYYNFKDLVNNIFPFIPSFMLRYDFPNSERIDQISAPITIFHGTLDEVVYFESSLKLKDHFKDIDRLIKIEGGHHNDLSEFIKYQNELSLILN